MSDQKVGVARGRGGNGVEVKRFRAVIIVLQDKLLCIQRACVPRTDWSTHAPEYGKRVLQVCTASPVPALQTKAITLNLPAVRRGAIGGNSDRAAPPRSLSTGRLADICGQ